MILSFKKIIIFKISSTDQYSFPKIHTGITTYSQRTADEQK